MDKEPVPSNILRHRLPQPNPKTQPENPLLSSHPEYLLGVDQNTALESAGTFLLNLPMKKALAIRRSLESLSDPTHKRYYSLIELLDPSYTGANPSSEGTSSKEMNTYPLRALDHLFDPTDGSLVIPATFLSVKESPFGEFFLQDKGRYIGNLEGNNGVIELRGLNYLIAENHTSDAHEKLSIIQKDLRDGLKMVADYSSQREQITHSQDYLLYLQIIDYLKIHTLTLFTSLTYNERLLQLPGGEEARKEYRNQRAKAQSLMETFTTMYYQTLIGSEYDHPLKPDQLQQEIESVVGYVTGIVEELESKPTPERVNLREQQNIIKSRSNKIFRHPEVTHPLVIALGAQEAARKYPDTDIVMGIPTGGTEAAIVTKLIYRMQQNKDPQILFLPVSNHSHIARIETDQLTEYLESCYGSFFENKKILVVDDNASSGDTLSLIASSLLARSAAKVDVHVVDFDSRKLLKADSEEPYFDSSHSPTTLGITNIDMHGNYVLPTYRKNAIGRARHLSRKQS